MIKSSLKGIDLKNQIYLNVKKEDVKIILK